MNPHRFLTMFVLACGLLPFAYSGTRGEKLLVLEGNVVPIKDEKDALGLSTAKATYPLIKDKGSLMFFQDKGLLNRPMRLTGHLIGDPARLQVINAHSLVKGKPHDIYYWCEICVIKRFQPGICDCCGDKLEFREVPARDK